MLYFCKYELFSMLFKTTRQKEESLMTYQNPFLCNLGFVSPRNYSEHFHKLLAADHYYFRL